MIKAIITDFDGTLVDTFDANYLAYHKAFAEVGIILTKERYSECFGLRFDYFMKEMGIADEQTVARIWELKKDYYPQFFERLLPNKALIDLIDSCRAAGIKTAIASTARKDNLLNVVTYLGISNSFDLIFAGVDVKQGKPSPEIYLKAMSALGVHPKETLVFEDSQVGIEAARASGAKCIVVGPKQFITADKANEN